MNFAGEADTVDRHVLMVTSSGECLFSRNYGHGPNLDVATLSSLLQQLGGFQAYYANISRNQFSNDTARVDGRDVGLGAAMPSPAILARIASEANITGNAVQLEASDFSAISILNARFVAKQLASYTLILSSPRDDGLHLCARQLHEVESSLTFLLGPPNKWRRTVFSLDGFEDVFERSVLGVVSQPDLLVGGVSKTPVATEVTERVDLALASLENDNTTLGSLVLLGDSVLHSRVNAEETRQVANLCSLRPLKNSQKVRITPVYSEGQWKSLVVLALRWHTLCLLVTIDTALMSVLPKMTQFEQMWEYMLSQTPIPTSVVSFSMSEVLGLDLIAFVLHDRVRCKTIAPPLRDDPSRVLHTATLVWFMRAAQEAFYQSKLSTVQLTKAHYKFFAVCDDNYQVFILGGKAVPSDRLEVEASRIVSFFKVLL
mmetsp:Transcript_13674/g.43707  ORF Transcript_13674/g.43707 Transcript_13674/m.43707 type:complete len:430 (+) Transcript_13674:88-1377(+)